MNLLALTLGGIIGICVAAALILIIIIWAIATYNSLVGIKTHCEDAHSSIDISLKKRYDLIPNVVETVKGYAKHEQETFLKVTQARTKLECATTYDEVVAADNAMSQAVRGLNMLVERYPELKANTNFMSLQRQLNDIETELSQARRYSNACVREYNKKIRTFPTLIIAKFMKLKTLAYFTVDSPEERQNVKVQF